MGQSTMLLTPDRTVPAAPARTRPSIAQALSALLALLAESGDAAAEACLARQTICRQIAAEQHQMMLRSMPLR